MSRRRLLLLVAVLAAALPACTAADRVQPPAQQVAGDAVAGRAAIEHHGCGSCHAIPQIPGARGVVGPPLENFGARRTIAGVLPNTPENLAAWIRDPQRIDPGNLMPDVGVSEADARNIAAFLSTLR